MALSKGKKIAIGLGVLALGLGFAGAANADDDVLPDDDDDPNAPPSCPLGQVPQIQPDGSWACVPIAIVDPVFPPADDDDDPLPPKPPTCNYSGCGPAFDGSHQHPSIYAQKLIDLGYPINIAGIAANGSFIAVSPQRDVVREFQRDYNAVRASPPAPAASPLAFAPIAAAGALAEDGLIGNKTIAALDRAWKAVTNSGMTWLAAVELSA